MAVRIIPRQRGRRQSVATSTSAVPYEHRHDDRVARATTRGWTWGNSTLAIREYDTDGKITDNDSAGLKSYSYDDGFRITAITDASNSSLSQSYGYDLLDRLTSATGPSLNQGRTYDANAAKASVTTTYALNALGQRVKKTTSGSSMYFVYDEDGHLVGEYDNSGNLI